MGYGPKSLSDQTNRSGGSAHDECPDDVGLQSWVLALRALFLMAFPHAFMAAADAAVRASALWVSVDIFIGLVGLYLTYVGWGPVPSRPVAQAETSNPDLSHAA